MKAWEVSQLVKCFSLTYKDLSLDLQQQCKSQVRDCTIIITAQTNQAQKKGHWVLLANLSAWLNCQIQGEKPCLKRINTESN